MPPRPLMSMRVKWNGREALFNNLFADQSASESNDGSGLVVCENETAVTNELRTAKANFASLIENQPYFEKGRDWCEAQITMRDPVKKAEYESAKQVEAIKQQFESVINAQNEKIDSLTDSVKSLLVRLRTMCQHSRTA